tara:strand:- start:1138 stop:1347 length:210 start_codon:yes stop_codon:yes gene_type:complete
MLQITPISTAANVSHVLANLTIDHAKAYEQAQDKYLFVFDNFCDAVSIDDIPIVIILDIEDKLEQLLDR